MARLRPVVQRYEAGEQAQFGTMPGQEERRFLLERPATKGAKETKRIEITYGEMIALAISTKLMTISKTPTPPSC